MSDFCVAHGDIGKARTRSRSPTIGTAAAAHRGITRPLRLEQHDAHSEAIEHHANSQSKGTQARPEGGPRLDANLPPAVALRDVLRQEGREHHCEEDGGAHQGQVVHSVAVRSVGRVERCQIIDFNLKRKKKMRSVQKCK